MDKQKMDEYLIQSIASYKKKRLLHRKFEIDLKTDEILNFILECHKVSREGIEIAVQRLKEQETFQDNNQNKKFQYDNSALIDGLRKSYYSNNYSIWKKVGKEVWIRYYNFLSNIIDGINMLIKKKNTKALQEGTTLNLPPKEEDSSLKKEIQYNAETPGAIDSSSRDSEIIENQNDLDL